MILILADKDDIHANTVIEHLERRGAEFVRLNQDVDSLLNTKATYDLVDWAIETAEGAFTAKQISRVWMRKSYVQMSLERVADSSPDFKLWKSEWNKTLQGLYSFLEHVPWLTPFREVFRAENKYLQLRTAQKCGFVIPPTIISNKKADLLAFANQHQRVALKLMHQDIYRMPDGTYQGLYTNILTSEDLSAFKQEGENTVVLQRYIDKRFEVRYTVVGEQHFVAKIDSQASDVSRTDWRRYDLQATPYVEIEPPIAIRETVQRFMQEMSLYYGALDFIVDEKGEWVFLEINPLGQYLWIEDLTGLPISQAIAQWLHQNSSN